MEARSPLSEYAADGIGLGALAALVALTALLLPNSPEGIVWVVGYFVLAAAALFIWHHPKAPELPTKWLLFALYSLPAAGLCYGYARLMASILFWHSEPEASKTFDILLALLVAPGLTVISVCGWVRTEFKRHGLKSSPEV